jgi:thiosulfate dehydrogenase
MSKTSRIIACSILVFGGVMISVHADPDLTMAPAVDVAEGGRLYDKWWVEYNLKVPTSKHPAYPAAGKKKGADTWRCKECHGWDYKGRDGLYGTGSHFTGIRGIQAFQGKSPEAVVRILKDHRHGFDAVMYDRALRLIAGFVVEGQLDMDKYIERGSKKARGDASRGRQLFMDNCFRCHGETGQDINVAHDPADREYVGTVARANPWEALHKIRNGHPGARMTHKQMHGSDAVHERHRQGLIRPFKKMPYMLESLTVEEQVDLLSFLQTLPE